MFTVMDHQKSLVAHFHIGRKPTETNDCMELQEKYSKYTHLKMMSRNVKYKGFVVVEIKHWYGLLSYSRLLHGSHFNTHTVNPSAVTCS